MCRFKSKKGFTLAELLVVVAIIAVLIAIAIPVFSASQKKAKLAVDHAAIRDAYAIVQIANNLEEVEIDGVTKTFNQLDEELLLPFTYYTLSAGCSFLVSTPPPAGFTSYILQENGANYGESCPTCAQWDATSSSFSRMHQKDSGIIVTYVKAEKKLYLGVIS